MTFEYCRKCGSIMDYCTVLQEGLELHFYQCPNCERFVPIEIKGHRDEIKESK